MSKSGAALNRQASASQSETATTAQAETAVNLWDFLLGLLKLAAGALYTFH